MTNYRTSEPMEGNVSNEYDLCDVYFVSRMMRFRSYQYGTIKIRGLTKTRSGLLCFFFFFRLLRQECLVVRCFQSRLTYFHDFIQQGSFHFQVIKLADVSRTQNRFL